MVVVCFVTFLFYSTSYDCGNCCRFLFLVVDFSDIAYDIVGVQPMQMPTGFLKH